MRSHLLLDSSAFESLDLTSANRTLLSLRGGTTPEPKLLMQTSFLPTYCRWTNRKSMPYLFYLCLPELLYRIWLYKGTDAVEPHANVHPLQTSNDCRLPFLADQSSASTEPALDN